VRARGTITDDKTASLMAALLDVPRHAEAVLDCHDDIKTLSERIARARDVLYLGRGSCFPIALEGALRAVQRSQPKLHLRSALTPPSAAA